jgi:hypothetical protein
MRPPVVSHFEFPRLDRSTHPWEADVGVTVQATPQGGRNER